MKLIFKSLLTAVCLQNLILISSFGQTIDYNTIILPSNAKNVSLEEKLVQLAWKNNPRIRIIENQSEIAQKNISVSKAAWLDMLRISGNLNEFTINPPENINRNYFYPRYNFGVTFNIGQIASIPPQVKIARIQHDNAIESINSEKLKLRADVLRNYYAYKQAKELYKLQSQITEDSYSSYQVVEQQFKNGEVSLEQYSKAFQDYNNQASNKIIKETNLATAKINLEELIGVKVDDVITD